MTETVAPGWYAGACKVCESPTYVIPGLTWVTCRACGLSSYARDHLETVLHEARPWVARPKALAAAVVALVDDQQSVPDLYGKIRTWGAREGKRTKAGDKPLRALTAVRVLDADGDPVGPKRYRLGDVLDMLDRERREARRKAQMAADALTIARAS